MDYSLLADIIIDVAPKPCLVLASAAVSFGTIGVLAGVPECLTLALIALGIAASPFVLAWLLGWRP